MCTCTTLPNGNVIVCDECAARAIDLLSDLDLESEDLELVNPLTPGEYQGIMGLIDGWFAIPGEKA